VFAVLGIIAAARHGLLAAPEDVPNLTGTGDGLAGWSCSARRRALLYVWENFKLFAEGQLLRIFALTEGGIQPVGRPVRAMAGAYIWARRTKFSSLEDVRCGRPARDDRARHRPDRRRYQRRAPREPDDPGWGVEYVNPNTLGEPARSSTLGRVRDAADAAHPRRNAAIPQRLKARLPDGALELIYFAIYGTGRFFLSFVRTDRASSRSAQAQLASALMFWQPSSSYRFFLRRASKPPRQRRDAESC